MRLALLFAMLVSVAGCVAGPVSHSIASYHPPVRTEPAMASSAAKPTPKPKPGVPSVHGPI